MEHCTVKGISTWIMATITTLVFVDVASGLRCYVCLYNLPGNNDMMCTDNVTSSMIQDCPGYAQFCQVEVVMIEHEIQKVERSCQAQCAGGCPRVEGYSRCISCCREDLCNTGSGATVVFKPSTSWALATLLSLTASALIQLISRS